MTEQQIPVLVGNLVVHQKAFAQLSVEGGQWVIQNTVEAIDLFAEAVANRQKATPPKPEPLLEWIGEVNIPATAEKFIARDKFVINTKSNAPVKISGLGSNFETWFLDKIEEPFTGSTLCYSKLRRWEKDIPIINELGGEEKAETSLTELFAVMGQRRDGNFKIFYIRDVNGVLCAVRVYWFGDGWFVSAGPIDGPRGWDGDFLVFSRRLLKAQAA